MNGLSIRKTLLAISVIASTAASANTAEDLARIRANLESGTDIAQVQFNLAHHATQQEIDQIVESMIVRRDFNGDGHNDFLVISEVHPHLENLNDNQPCSDTIDPNCRWVYGKRFLQYFEGLPDGGLKLVFTNDKMVRQADEGGQQGDPINGFTVRPNGTIWYSIYGGSAWRWSYTDTIQFRNGDFYMIGLDTYAGWVGDMRADTKSINLLTGQVVETHQKDGDSPVREKRYHVPVKPLAKLSSYPGSGPN